MALASLLALLVETWAMLSADRELLKDTLIGLAYAWLIVGVLLALELLLLWLFHWLWSKTYLREWFLDRYGERGVRRADRGSGDYTEYRGWWWRGHWYAYDDDDEESN